jgi:ketosteroid isomerase-like protein
MIVSFVILNMFVAVVLQAFEASSEGELLEPSDLEHFVSVWSEFDPDATWFINASDVQSFLSRLQPPLGMAGQVSREEGTLYPKDQEIMEISVNDKKQVNIVNVASLLAKRHAKEKQGDEFGELSDDHPVQSRLARKSSIDDATTTLGEVYVSSASVILRAVVRFRRRRRVRADEELNDRLPAEMHQRDGLAPEECL